MEKLEKMLNRSGLGLQQVIDSLQPTAKSVLGHREKNSGTVVANISRGQRFKHKEFQPARVDIGLRGHMPFDDALLKAPGDKRKSMFVVGEARKRASKSELGFHTTIGSMATTSQAHGAVSNKSPAVEDEEEHKRAITTNVSTNHPGTLLKNFNPRIAPKNRDSEQARQKVKNISQRRKRSPQPV